VGIGRVSFSRLCWADFGVSLGLIAAALPYVAGMLFLV